MRWADVVVESFSPRGRAALGLDYERLAELRPGLVMMSSCLFGQSGPLERYAGFGTMGASLGGFFHLTGWPDRPPCGPFGAYSDYPSPRFALCAVLAALDHRRRTGRGPVPRLRPGRGVRALPRAGGARSGRSTGAR